MNTVRVDQALFGYSDGHRLLASSRSISGAPARLLRAVSDMAFDGALQSYLTVLPVIDLEAQAFIRSWPGPQGGRPGSVWSHVLLVPFVDLGHLRRLTDVVSLFRRPELDVLDRRATDAFKVAAELDTDAPTGKTSWRVDELLARNLVSAIYATEATMSFVADIEESEQVLLAIYEQQWPRLRRTFSFRTRSKQSPNPSFPFDVEVVESARSQSKPHHLEAGWVDVLIKDLQQPDPQFRDLLRTFGAESAGRRDAPGLVTVLSAARGGAAPVVVLDELCSGFPAPMAMRALKRALLGSISDSSPEPFPGWPFGDMARLALLFQKGRSCVDLNDLDVSSRLRTAWHTRPRDVAELVSRAQVEDLTEDQIESIVSATASDATPSEIAHLARQNSDWALLIARENPAVVESADIWSVGAIVPSLLDIVRSLPRPSQIATLAALLGAEREPAAASVCSLDASLWWEAFSVLAAADGRDRVGPLLTRAASLRRVLDEIGPAAIGEAPSQPSGENELVMLAFCANPTAGLWRRASPEAWVTLIETIPKATNEQEWESVVFRLCALAVTAATQSGSADLRRRAWLSSFAILHQGLLAAEDADEAWMVLRGVLPRAPEWDRCGRLRKAAVETAVRDRWPVHDVDTLLRAVPAYGHDLAQALHKQEERKKRSRGWFFDFIANWRP